MPWWSHEEAVPVMVYRGIWRYTGIDDLVVHAKAVVIGAVASVLAILFAFRFEGVSRTVFIVDAILMFMLLAGSRMAFRLFRQLLPTQTARDGCRVLIYGAGAGGYSSADSSTTASCNTRPSGSWTTTPTRVARSFTSLGLRRNGHLRDSAASARAVSPARSPPGASRLNLTTARSPVALKRM